MGKELKVGDDVVYIYNTKSSSCFSKSKIARFTEKCIFMEDGSRKYGDKILKID